MEKEEAARVEKHAQAHLDKAQTTSASATKIALAWIVALLLLWTQKLEPNLLDVQKANLTTSSIRGASEQGHQTGKLENDLAGYLYSARQDDIELPFSIKFKLPPQWTPTLWLALSFGLIAYLLQSRWQVLFLAARGLELFRAAGSEPPYTKAIVGSVTWWVAPFPLKGRDEEKSSELRRALGMGLLRLRLGELLVIAAGLALLAVALRVFYVGLSVTAFLLVTHPAGPSDIFAWWGLTVLNTSLCCGLFLAAAGWFSLNPVVTAAEEQPSTKPFDRRAALRFIAVGAGAIASCVLGLSTSTYAFGSKNIRQPKKLHGPIYGPKRVRNKNAPARSPHLLEGLYQNEKTGTIHTASASCKRCLAGVGAAALQKVDPSSISWGMREGESDKTIAHSKAASLLPQQVLDRRHLHRRHRTFILEAHALDLIKQGKSADACEMLWRAIGKDSFWASRANMRLYDLTAGLAVRAQKPQILESLIATLESSSMPFLDDSASHHIVDHPTSETEGYLTTLLLELSGSRRISGGGSSEPNQSLVVRRRRHHHVVQSSQMRGPKLHPHSQYLAAMMRERTVKWKKPESAWHKKWSGKSKPIRWGNNPKDQII